MQAYGKETSGET